MSSGEKLAKGKSKKAAPKAKSTKGKEVSVNDQRFRGDGMKFKCKLVGSADVSSARGDAMCTEAIKKLKVQALKLNKESGEHKQRIVFYVTLKGIRIVDEKTQKVQHEHPINKISFITHDPEDKKIFGYICSQPCTTGHKLFAVKSEKPAGVVTGTLYELFQVVFQLRQQAGLTKKVPNSAAQVSNGPSLQPASEGIYEVPYKNGNNKEAETSPQVDHEYAEPVTAVAKKDPHYQVPKNLPVQATLPPVPGENNKYAEVGQRTALADVSNSSTLLSQSSMDKEPDQVSQASMDAPLTPHDNSSADMAFFSPSIFESVSGESGAADTVSVTSADISVLRSGSVSSGSSESHSQDTKSVHSRSSSQTAATEGFQAEFTTAFDDQRAIGPSLDSKVEQEEEEVLESGNQGDMPVVVPPLSNANMEATFKAPPVLKTSAGFESDPDPFASSDFPTNEDERTQPVAGENFFTASFAAFDASFSDVEVKSDGDDKRKDDSSSADPFASSSGAQEKGNAFESAEGFVSETSFETAFGSERFTPSQGSSSMINNHAQEGSEDEKTLKTESSHQSVENSAVSFSWDNAFGETKAVSQSETTQSAAAPEVQFSWTESFTSEDVETSAKAGPSTSASVSWDDAFGGALTTDKESSNQVQDAFSWDDAFGGMAGDSDNPQPDSSPFGDAFASSSTVESCNDVSGVTAHGVEPVSQSAVPGNPQLNDTPSVPEHVVQPVSQFTAADKPKLFEDEAFTTLSSLQFQDSTTNVQSTELSADPPALSKDPFEGLKASFPVPASKPGKIDLEETEESSKPELFNANEDSLFANENVSRELPSGDNARETNNVEEIGEILTPTGSQDSDAMDKTKTDEILEGPPSELLIQESTAAISERSVSPTVPPPLPPRPELTAPPLPARPSSSSSTMSVVSPQTSTGSPASNSPHQGKKGSAKKTPPALPPRIDLNEKSANSSSHEKEAFSDPFGVDLFDQKFEDSKGATEAGNSDWVASWPNSQGTSSREKSKDLSDPFSEDFFTNFDFPQKPASSTTKSDNLDPFATTNPSSELFPSAFGNQDLFAAFTPAKGNVAFDSGDPFKNDLSDSFAAFSLDDPFSDISDPFADKGVLSDDPFGDSPRKPQSGKSLTLSESPVASDEADSFA